MDILELLALGKDFNVTKKDGEFEVERGDIAAVISKKGDVSYFITGAYNSGNDWLEIDMNEFKAVEKFCELIIKQEEM